MQNFKLLNLFLIGCTLCKVTANAQRNSRQPRLVHTQEDTRLYVGENPFLILGGELGNSTAQKDHWQKVMRSYNNCLQLFWKIS